MGKFQNLPPRAPLGAITGVPGVVPTYEGGVGHLRDPKSELFLLAVTNMVGEHTFYESATKRDARYADLIHACVKEDPAWVASFAPWLRNVANMRSASLVMAAEYVKAGGPKGRTVVSRVLQRPDEPAEMLAYWHAVHGRKIPMAVKRGVADAAERMYTEWAALKWDGTGSPWRMGDVIELTHPKPRAGWQSDLFRFLVSKRHRGTEAVMPESLETIRADRILQAVAKEQRRSYLPQAIAAGWSWERVAGWLPDGMDASAWEAVIPNMGYMALLRNLRNFEQKGVSIHTVAQVNALLADPAEVARSRQLPFRFLTAYRNTGGLQFVAALEQALDLSLASIPPVGGTTLVMLDVSGSMHDAVSAKSTVKRADVAAVLGVALARRWSARVVAYDTSCYELDRGQLISSARSVLRATDLLRGIGGGGTYTWQALSTAYQGEDRVVIITDEQSHPGRVQADVKRLYTWNVAGYRQGHAQPKPGWYTFGGFSDVAFTLIPLLERAEGSWPWEVQPAATPLVTEDEEG